jgi:8-oxo-dGTP diphosphatase
VDKWESLQQAVLRELKEELNLEWEIIKQVGIYDDPKRDPRGHTISVAYRIQASGIPKAQDDAKSFEWINIEDIKNGKIKLAFDHKKIILDAL